MQAHAGPILFPLALGAAIFASQAADVRIDRIEIADKYATVHFDTEPNRSYRVQAKTNIVGTNWVTIYTAPSRPFSDHYVVADERTNKFRFYRLLVTP